MGSRAHLLTRCSKWWGFPVPGVIHALTGNLGLSTTLVFAILVPLLTAPWSHCFSFTWSQYYFLLLMLLSVPGSTHPLNPTYFQTISFLLPGLLFYLLVDPPNSLLLTCSGSPIHAPTPILIQFLSCLQLPGLLFPRPWVQQRLFHQRLPSHPLQCFTSLLCPEGLTGYSNARPHQMHLPPILWIPIPTSLLAQ